LTVFTARGNMVPMLNGSSIIPQESKYLQLLQECQQTLTEFEFTSRWALIEGYHAVGKLIVDSGYAKRVSDIAKNLNRGVRTIEKAVQLYEKYPDLLMMPGGKNMTWHDVANKVLTTPKEKVEKECEHEWIQVCRKCGKRNG